MSINTTKKIRHITTLIKMKISLKKNHKTLMFYELSNTKKLKRLHHFPILEPNKKKTKS